VPCQHIQYVDKLWLKYGAPEETYGRNGSVAELPNAAMEPLTKVPGGVGGGGK
jgi:hypothetical protein